MIAAVANKWTCPIAMHIVLNNSSLLLSMVIATGPLAVSLPRLLHHPERELAGFGDFLFSAAAGVFSICLGAQKLVGQIGVLALDQGQLGL